MSEAPAPERRRSSFWLIASLCVNFFLIGVIVTGLIVARNRMAAGNIGAGAGLPPEVVLQMLPPSGAVKMCAVLSTRMNTFRALGRDLAESRRAVFKVFRAEPFDSSAFAAALKKLTASQVALLQEREATVADVVGRLTPDERRHFSRQIMRRFFSWKGNPGRHGRGAVAEICMSVGAGGANLQ